jgi:hypothetical protein
LPVFENALEEGNGPLRGKGGVKTGPGMSRRTTQDIIKILYGPDGILLKEK